MVLNSVGVEGNILLLKKLKGSFDRKFGEG